MSSRKSNARSAHTRTAFAARRQARLQRLVVSWAGATPKPDIDESAVAMRDYAYSLIRVLDMDGNALGPGHRASRRTICAVA